MIVGVNERITIDVITRPLQSLPMNRNCTDLYGTYVEDGSMLVLYNNVYNQLPPTVPWI